jgi:diguanylate cyclase (GGDEF)-like protein
MARMLGYESVEQALEDAAESRAPRFFRNSRHEDPKWWRVDPAVNAGVDVQIVSKRGEKRWIHFNVREVLQDGKLVRLEGTAEDATNRKLSELRTELLAYYDSLTGLPNRMYFSERMRETLAAAEERGRTVALILVELEEFKTVNDFHGDQFGDRLLQEASARIREGTREDCIVARVGGSEFAIAQMDGNEKHWTATAGELVASLNAEYSFLGHTLTTRCNVGISSFPENGSDCETLMRRADMAMARARDKGTNHFSIFTQELDRKLMERKTLESGLRQALARNELYLDYQPQVDLRTGAITGLEALLRWNHQELGLIPPNHFIGIAEDCGLIVPIGDWVMQTACEQTRAWQKAGLPAVQVAVNVSAIQFRQRGFCDRVAEVLRETGLAPELLELELTESLLLTNADLMSSIAGRLREMGVTLAIDDFGTGYSSLGYLKQFKVNRLKIARSFIKDIPGDADDAAISIAIIEMARALNLAVLAEGVETDDQLSFLRKQECYTIQGFYFSKPVSVERAGELLETGFKHLIQASNRFVPESLTNKLETVAAGKNLDVCR